VLGGQLTAERAQFSDITAHLKSALAATAARAEGLEAALAENRAALAAAQAAASEAAAAAEARRAADVDVKQAELEGQAERVRQADAFLEERDLLCARTAAAEAAAEEEKRQHHKRVMVRVGWSMGAVGSGQVVGGRACSRMCCECACCRSAAFSAPSPPTLPSPSPTLPPQDLERKHASDSELWRRDTAEAVRGARAEMAAAADQRLDATTKQTICDNEAMAGKGSWRVVWGGGRLFCRMGAAWAAAGRMEAVLAAASLPACSPSAPSLLCHHRRASIPGAPRAGPAGAQLGAAGARCAGAAWPACRCC
jgi:hypothetical protein